MTKLKNYVSSVKQYIHAFEDLKFIQSVYLIALKVALSVLSTFSQENFLN